jgi:hypothetical protein
VIVDEPAAGDSNRQSSAGYYSAGVLLGSGIYLYLNLFALPRTPFLLGGDQVVFWVNAQRLLRGELIYRDFLEFTPPGADVLYLGAFSLLGSRIWVPNLVVLLLGMILCWLCFHIACSIMKPPQAALTVALLMVLDYGKLLDGTHHWFSVLAVMGAVAAVLKARTLPRVALAGILLGVAAFFTQSRGPTAALGIAGCLAWDGFQTQESWSSRVRRQLMLFIPLVAAWGACSCYFIAKIGLWQLWYFQVTYVRRYVASGPSDLSFRSPEILAWLKTLQGFAFLLVYFTIPVVYGVCLWICKKGTREVSPGSAQRVVLLAVVGAAMYVEVSQSPNMVRVYCVAVPAIILFVWLLTVEVTRTWRRYAPAPIWTGLICLAAHQTYFRHSQQSVIVDLPAGTIATTPLGGEKLAWLARRTVPGQLFFEARWVDLYLPLALRNPAFIDQLESGHYSRSEFVERSIRQLEAKRVEYIIWAPRLEAPAYPYASFREFLGEHYQRVMTFADRDEVWERK